MIASIAGQRATDGWARRCRSDAAAAAARYPALPRLSYRRRSSIRSADLFRSLSHRVATNAARAHGEGITRRSARNDVKSVRVMLIFRRRDLKGMRSHRDNAPNVMSRLSVGRVCPRLRSISFVPCGPSSARTPTNEVETAASSMMVSIHPPATTSPATTSTAGISSTVSSAICMVVPGFCTITSNAAVRRIA